MLSSPGESRILLNPKTESISRLDSPVSSVVALCFIFALLSSCVHYYLRLTHSFAIRETVLPKHVRVEGSFEREVEDIRDMPVECVDQECLQPYQDGEHDPASSGQGQQTCHLVVFDNPIVHLPPEMIYQTRTSKCCC